MRDHVIDHCFHEQRLGRFQEGVSHRFGVCSRSGRLRRLLRLGVRHVDESSYRGRRRADTGAGQKITTIELTVEAQVPGMDDAAFQEQAEKTKAGCPVSKALAAVPQINLHARLL